MRKPFCVWDFFLDFEKFWKKNLKSQNLNDNFTRVKQLSIFLRFWVITEKRNWLEFDVPKQAEWAVTKTRKTEIFLQKCGNFRKIFFVQFPRNYFAEFILRKSGIFQFFFSEFCVQYPRFLFFGIFLAEKRNFSKKKLVEFRIFLFCGNYLAEKRKFYIMCKNLKNFFLKFN